MGYDIKRQSNRKWQMKPMKMLCIEARARNYQNIPTNLATIAAKPAKAAAAL